MTKVEEVARAIAVAEGINPEPALLHLAGRNDLARLLLDDRAPLGRRGVV